MITTDYMEETLRLYSTDENGLTFVWIYGIDDNIYIDRGLVGQTANQGSFPTAKKAAIDLTIKQFTSIGFAEVDEDDMPFLEIVFNVKDKFADGEELGRRNELLDSLEEFLALTGQGWVDGASNGMGTMEIGILVVDADIAKLSLQTWLNDNGYGDYREIIHLTDE